MYVCASLIFPFNSISTKVCFQRHHYCILHILSRAAVVHLNFRAGSTFSVPVCTVISSMDRTSRCNKVDSVRLFSSYRLNLLLLKGQMCVSNIIVSLLRPILLKRILIVLAAFKRDQQNPILLKRILIVLAAYKRDQQTLFC